MGKGSSPRPYSVDAKTFDNNWERIFGSKELKTETQSQEQKDSQKEQTKCNG